MDGREGKEFPGSEQVGFARILLHCLLWRLIYLSRSLCRRVSIDEVVNAALKEGEGREVIPGPRQVHVLEGRDRVWCRMKRNEYTGKDGVPKVEMKVKANQINRIVDYISPAYNNDAPTVTPPPPPISTTLQLRTDNLIEGCGPFCLPGFYSSSPALNGSMLKALNPKIPPV